METLEKQECFGMLTSPDERNLSKAFCVLALGRSALTDYGYDPLEIFFISALTNWIINQGISGAISFTLMMVKNA